MEDGVCWPVPPPSDRIFRDVSKRSPLPAAPGADEHARARAARDVEGDDRSPGAGLRGARSEAPGRDAARLPYGRRRLHLSGVGSGAWEAAVANTLSPGDTVLAFEQGFFARGWMRVAEGFGIEVLRRPWDPRRGLTARRRSRGCAGGEDGGAATYGRCSSSHNDTSTGVTTRPRASIGAGPCATSGHPALLLRRRGLVARSHRPQTRRVGH